MKIQQKVLFPADNPDPPPVHKRGANPRVLSSFGAFQLLSLRKPVENAERPAIEETRVRLPTRA